MLPRANVCRICRMDALLVFGTGDYREGVNAFLAKRKAEFKGR